MFLALCIVDFSFVLCFLFLSCFFLHFQLILKNFIITNSSSCCRGYSAIASNIFIIQQNSYHRVASYNTHLPRPSRPSPPCHICLFPHGSGSAWVMRAGRVAGRMTGCRFPANPNTEAPRRGHVAVRKGGCITEAWVRKVRIGRGRREGEKRMR